MTKTIFEIGVWENHRRKFLKEYHRIKYDNLLTSSKLYPHLADVEQQARESVIYSPVYLFLFKS